MATTITEIIDAFDLYYRALHSREFCKTLKLNELSERELHPLMRSFLLGYFGDVSPEVMADLPGSKSRYGRIDYVIDDVAVELAVRRPGQGKSSISQVTNATEAKKLLKWDGLALLVLYDFSGSPFDDNDLTAYRDWPSLGRGSHNISAFNVAYYYRDGGESYVKRKNIRI